MLDVMRDVQAKCKLFYRGVISTHWRCQLLAHVPHHAIAGVSHTYNTRCALSQSLRVHYLPKNVVQYHVMQPKYWNSHQFWLQGSKVVKKFISYKISILICILYVCAFLQRTTNQSYVCSLHTYTSYTLFSSIIMPCQDGYIYILVIMLYVYIIIQEMCCV